MRRLLRFKHYFRIQKKIMSEKKKSGLSGVLTGVIVVVLIVRIGMILSRNKNSASPIWDNTYLLWSVFVLVLIVGAYIWDKNKKR